jgi:chromosome segregation ATPase
LKADFELNIYKEKVLALQKELEEFKSPNNNDKSYLSDNQEASEFDPQHSYRKSITNLDRTTDSPKIDEYKTTISKLRHELKESKKKINEYQNVQNKEIERNKITISELTVGISRLRKDMEQKDLKAESFENYIRDLEDEIQELKTHIARTKQTHEKNNSTGFEKLNIDKDNVETMDNMYKTTINELRTQTNNLKKELEQARQFISQKESEIEAMNDSPQRGSPKSERP